MTIEATNHLQPERFRGYLIVLARASMRASARLQNKIDASDIVQEVLLQAHMALPELKGTTEGELAAWLRAILANKLADAARHYGRKKRDAALEQSYREAAQQFFCNFKVGCGTESSPLGSRVQKALVCELLVVNLRVF